MQNDILWTHPVPVHSSGIIVGCDENQEWILPWWWKHYSLHNDLPVLFIDFGLSIEAAQWCEQRGKVLSLQPTAALIKSREEIPISTVKKWEKAYGNGFWKARPSWYKKPFALLQTIFKTTLWLDLDCEVKGDISGLFTEHKQELSLSAEPEYGQQHLRAFNLSEDGEVIYNSGVILYRHGCPVVENWAKESIQRNQEFWSDQNLLSRLIFEKKSNIIQLPSIYNWHVALGKNEQARIVHWLGDLGKEYIRLNMHGFL